MSAAVCEADVVVVYQQQRALVVVEQQTAVTDADHETVLTITSGGPPGPPGAKGDPGEPGGAVDLPDLSVTFENALY